MTAVDAAVDVVVIGGGMAGITVAAELAATHSVTVVEQEQQLGHHATGRSAAAYLESYGSPEVRALTRASGPLFASAETDVPLLTPRTMIWVASPEQEAALAGMLAEQPHLQRLTGAEALALCPVLRPDQVVGAALDPGARDIDVAAMLQLHTTRAQRLGATMHRGAPVVHAKYDDAAGEWRVQLGDGAVVVARVVVDAAGAWADEVAALLGATPCGLGPLRRSIAIARTPRTVDSAWPLVVDAEEQFYFRPEGPHILLSPADETPSEPCDARAEEADVALAIERINRATTLGIRNVVTTWAGLRTFAPDRNPVVGFDPDVPGLFWLAGQGGYGIQMAPALGQAAAALIRGDAVPGDLLVGLSPSRFRG